jgi:hypothetical protein
VRNRFAGPDGREVLQLHLKRRSGAETVLEKMAHGDIQGRCQNSAVERTLRIDSCGVISKNIVHPSSS